MDATAVSIEGAEYYANPYVQQRVRDYCASGADPLTCTFVSQLTPDRFATWATAPRFEPGELPALFAAGWDISRSLLDRRSLTIYFELDVADADAPGDALRDPAHAFDALEPVYGAVQEELTRLALPLLDVMTGRGYHFSGRVPLESAIVRDLRTLAPADAPPVEQSHIALGMVLEHLAHAVARRARAPLPLVLNGVEVGRGGRGREAASLDLSGYGDPVGERQMRSAFSTYQSHRVRPDLFGDATACLVPVLVAVPRRGRPLPWMLRHARRSDDVALLARTEDTHLPDVTDGFTRLLDEYARSRLAAFHRAFYDEDLSPSAAWPDTDAALESLPPCVAHGLRHPNDALLKPTVLQHVTRYFMAHGWPPRQVAGLVWSRYARDYDWGDRWTRLDARRRAEFDVRVFAAAVVDGLDGALDFNCVSAQEKGLCPRLACTRDLRRDQRALRERVRA